MPKLIMLLLGILFTFFTTLSKSVEAETDVQTECKNVFIFNTTNCTSWQEAQLTGDVNDYQVTVCKTGKTKAVIQPLSYLWFSNINIDYNHLTNKFYTTFKVQLTSSRILDEISKKPEFNSTKVSFLDFTKVRFVLAPPQYMNLKFRMNIKLNEDWMKIEETESNNNKFAELKFSSDTQEAAADIVSQSDSHEAKPGNSMKSTVKVELKTKDLEIIRTSLRRPYPLMNITELKYSPKKELKSLKEDLCTAAGINWKILMQRRETAGVDFNRNWIEYKNGFGDWRNDFWLGLEKIHQITKEGGYGLRMEFESHKGLQRSAQWENFRVEGEEEKYKLIISGFDRNSSAGYDGMARSNGGRFATVDKDNSYICAKLSGGGWWFNRCMLCHFNNQLRSSIENTSGTCVFYHKFKGYTYSNECLKRVRMFIIKH